MKYDIHVQEEKLDFKCNEDESILHGLYRLGLKGIPVGCRGGGCGVCKVQILDGTYRTKIMSKAHVSDDDLKCDKVLACRAFPSSNVVLKVLGKMKKAWATDK